MAFFHGIPGFRFDQDSSQPSPDKEMGQRNLKMILGDCTTAEGNVKVWELLQLTHMPQSNGLVNAPDMPLMTRRPRLERGESCRYRAKRAIEQQQRGHKRAKGAMTSRARRPGCDAEDLVDTAHGYFPKWKYPR